jgi:glycerol-3-phosphate dehydrogenase
MYSRSEAIEKLASKVYDVCVIGGGATGAGCALDAQLRGLTTALLDAGDFGSATSSASTKLIHGGLRYLRQAISEWDFGQYRMVRKALRERRLMMRNAPHLTRICRFIIPCFSLSEALYYRAGLKLYDWLSGEAVLARSFFERGARASARIHGFKTTGLVGAVGFADGLFEECGFFLSVVQTCSVCLCFVVYFYLVVVLVK